MSLKKVPARLPARLCGAPGAQRAARGVLLIATLMLGAACGEDGGGGVVNPWPPFTMQDSAVIVGDSSFIPPVIQPPPMGLQEAGLPEAGWLDAGSAAAVGDAGGMDAGPPGSMDGGALTDAAPSAEAGAPDAGDAAVSGGDGGTGNPCGDGPEPLAANIRVHEISLYQVVKIPLYKSNAWVTSRNAAVVQGKKSLVRVFVTPQTGYQPHPLRGVLTLDNDGTKTALISNRTISTTSTDAATDSTFDFTVDGALIKGSTQLSVSVLEPTCMPPAANTGARLPASGGQALNADAINKLRVVIVPLTMGGRTPDTSQAQLDKYKAGFLAFYPVSEVEISAHAPVSTSLTARADGGGWSDVLNVVMQTRARDAPAASVYYYGIMLPAASFTTYCRTGCVLGLAPLNRIVSRGNQIGLGVGFVDEESIKTAVHEIGHAHGLPHAPCAQGGSIQGADTAFPYSGAKIGVWGWDSRSSKLLSPTTYVDLMSYCTPEWISDYNYAKLATRSKSVNTAAYVLPGELTSQRWHGIVLRGDGSARWANVVQDQLPAEPTKARVLDSAGGLVANIEVAKVELSEGADSFLYIPEPGPRWAKIDLGDRVLDLAAVQPAAQ